MKARIEKKLSKRVVNLAPTIFSGWWIDKEVSDTAISQKTSVTHIPSIGGVVDYFGERGESYSAWEYWRTWWAWIGGFEPYPEGHKYEYFPNTDGFKPTTRNLLLLASYANENEVNQRKNRKRKWQGSMTSANAAVYGG